MYAPRPSIADCRKKRKVLVAIEKVPVRSPDVSWASIAAPRMRCQRSCTAPCMPSAWIISLCWRTVSAKLSPCMVATVASVSCRLVKIWFRTVAAIRSSIPATARWPSIGWKL